MALTCRIWVGLGNLLVPEFSVSLRTLWLLLQFMGVFWLIPSPQIWLFGYKSDLSFLLLLFKANLPHKPLAWCKTLLWWQHPPLTLLCWRVKCLGLLLGADERCCIAELCSVLEHYVLEAASENVSLLLLTSIVSSCPNSVVLVAEDVGGCLFFSERRKEEGDGNSEADN